MAETVTEPAVTIEKTSTPKPLLQAWQPFESLRRKMDRLFHVFDRGVWRPPLRGGAFRRSGERLDKKVART